MSAKRDSRRKSDSVLVVGLGRFGTAVAGTLIELGCEVLAVDANADLVQRWSSELTRTVQADSTDEEAMRQLGVADFDRAVLAIGDDIEASVLTALVLVEAGIPTIWGKAITAKHAKILSAIGVRHVVLPEASMGTRMAHMLAGAMDDYVEFEAGYAMARIKAPALMWGIPLGQSGARSKFQLTVVGIKRPGESFTYADHSTVVHRNDDVIISGSVRRIEEFSQLPKDSD